MSQDREAGYFSAHDSPLERRIGNLLKLFVYIGIGSLLCMVFLTVRHAIGRYAFSSPVAGNSELSCIMLAVLIFMVMAYTQVLKGHISISVVTDRMSPRAQAVVESAMNILYLGIIVLAVWRTGVQFNFQVAHGNVTSVLHILFYPIYAVLVFGWAVLALAVAVQLYHSMLRAVKGVRE